MFKSFHFFQMVSFLISNKRSFLSRKKKKNGKEESFICVLISKRAPILCLERVRNRPFIQPEKHPTLQVRSVDAKEALRLQKENNFVILDVRPEAEFKEVSLLTKFCNSLGSTTR